MTIKVAIMQPYVFPYMGYFCLAESSDLFVFYDDVNFIKRGWINRNRILVNGVPHGFTVPLFNASQNELICDVKLHEFPFFKRKFRKQLVHAYGKAPNFSCGMQYVDDVLNGDYAKISDMAIASIEKFFAILGIQKAFMRSSRCFRDTRAVRGADRLIDITKALDADNYVNPIGGVELYEKAYFLERGVPLSFIRPTFRTYKQVGSEIFFPSLSVIDVIMNNKTDVVVDMVKDYAIV